MLLVHFHALLVVFARGLETLSLVFFEELFLMALNDTMITHGHVA